MNDNSFYIAELVRKSLLNQLSADDSKMLDHWLNSNAEHRLLFEEITSRENLASELKTFEETDILPARLRIEWLLSQKSDLSTGRTRRIHFLNTVWFRYAASIIVLLSISVYLFTFRQNKLVVDHSPVRTQDVSAPASAHATITLTNGTKIILDSTANGNLAYQDNILLKKLDDGQVVYSGSASKVMYNTLTNPKGSKAVIMTLSDGTKVWLNSHSTITYPTAFIKNERVVEIAGEVYFEVAQDHSRPFKVRNKEIGVAVLGTSFNMNTYEDEKEVKITLVEGAVNVSLGSKTKMLKPAEQASVTDQIQVIKNVNVEEVVAWKNGKFEFTNVGIEAIMRQVQRWYNVEVEYEGPTTGLVFTGSVLRTENLSRLLSIMELTGLVGFKIEGRKIIVVPK